jgi:hypothetical protein
MKLPRVIGLTLCETYKVDPQIGQVSLVGVFQALSFSTFPSPPHTFVVYVLLDDGIGEGTIELRITHLETERDIYVSKKWVKFPGRGYVVNREIRVRSCVFPTLGRYLVTLRFEGHEITNRAFDVLPD